MRFPTTSCWIASAIALLVCCVLASPAAAQDTAAAPVVAINSQCPVMPEEAVDPEITLEYEGRVIGFCCRMCRGKFRKEPQAYLVNLVEAPVEVDEAPAEPTAAATPPAEPVPVVPEEAATPAAGANAAAPGAVEDEPAPARRWVSWLGEFHMPATDLPIGLLFGAALAELLFMMTRKDALRHAAGYCVVVATIGAVAAATLGWFHAGAALFDGDWMMTLHRWLGTAAAAGSVATAALLARCSRKSEAPRSRRGFRIALFATTGLLGGAGFFGGALVFGLDHYAW